MSRPPELIIRLVAQAAWRRRYHLIISLLVMMVASLVAAKFLPQNYEATSLMLLQESSKANPFERDTNDQSQDRLRERIAGLEALLKSERVLGKALNDMRGGQPISEHQRAADLDDLRKAVSLDLLGNDFLEFRLKGRNGKGLGRRLETVTSRFLEALLPVDDEVTAAQVLLAKRKDEVEAADQAEKKLKLAFQTMLPAGEAATEQRLASLRTQASQKSSDLIEIDEELSKLAPRPNIDARPGTTLDIPVAQAEAAHNDGPSGAASLGQGTDQSANMAKARDLEERKAKAARELISLQEAQEGAQSSLDEYRMTRDRIVDLSKALATAQDTYAKYAKRYATADAKHSVSVLNAPDRILIVDAAKDPDAPTISSMMYVIGGLLSGVLMGVLLAVAAELLDSRILYPHEVSEKTGLPVLAVLPGNSASENLAFDDRRSWGMAKVFILLLLTIFLVTSFTLLSGSQSSLAYFDGRLFGQSDLRGR